MKRIHWKSFGPISLAFFAVAVLVLWYFPSRQTAALSHALRNKAHSMAALLAYSVAPAVEFSDTESVREALDGAATDSDARYAAVLTESGTLRVVRAFHGHDATRAAPLAAPVDEPVLRDGLLHVAVPVHVRAGTRAHVVTGFSTEEVERTAAQHRTIAWGIALFIMCAGLSVAWFISRSITRTERLLAENRAALESAKAASRAKSQFLANTSHEIRTPLNGVLGLAHLLTRSAVNPDQRQLAESIERSGQQLLDIVNDILDFSKIEAGRLELVEEAFDLVDCVEDVTGTFAQSASAKNLEMICQVDPDLPRRVRGDSLRLRQILTNLVGNAVKFTREGQVILRVQAEDMTGGQTRFQFDVEDSGIGMTPEQQVSVFSAFSQGDATTTRKFGGTGLGLAICKQLANMMNGELRVSSEEGRGSVFSFIVPLPLDDSQQRPALPSLRGVRALVVDDHPISRQVVKLYLNDSGAITDEAADGQQALLRVQEAAEQGVPYDVLLLDLRMPEIDGLEVARRVRANPDLQSVGILLLSAFSQGDAETQALGASFLTKPIRQRTLLEAVKATTQGNLVTSLPPYAHISPLTAPVEGSGHGPLVLVAEDNETNRFVIEGMLETLGYRVQCVHDGKQAVDAFTASQDLALVLMDCQMPVMDGYTATAEIRKWEAETGAPRRPIIAVTAHAFKDDRDRAHAAGMDDYVTKPVDFRALRDALTRWCAVPTSAPPPDPTPPPSSRTDAPPSPASPVGPDVSPSLSTAPQRSVLDEQTVRRLRGLQSPKRPRFFASAVERYVEGSRQALEQLRQAAANANGEALRQAAHSLKGSSRMVGAVRAADLAEQIEVLSKEEATRVTDAHLDRLAREIQAAHEALAAVAEAV